MTTTNDSARIRYIGGMLARGDAQIVGREQISGADRWVIHVNGEALQQSVLVSLRPSWVRWAHRGRPAGRKRLSEPVVQMTLRLPESDANWIPTPRQRTVATWIKERRMETQSLMCKCGKSASHRIESSIDGHVL